MPSVRPLALAALPLLLSGLAACGGANGPDVGRTGDVGNIPLVVATAIPSPLSIQPDSSGASASPSPTAGLGAATPRATAGASTPGAAGSSAQPGAVRPSATAAAGSAPSASAAR